MRKTPLALPLPVTLFGQGLVFVGTDLFVLLGDGSFYFEGS